MTPVNVVPIQAQPPDGAGTKCPNCAAAIVPDQRYCLACGQPCSPVRLAFLDVLQAESELRAPLTIAPPPAAYLPPLSAQEGTLGRLRRYSGLFGLLAVLLITGLIGLLVGHWLAPSKSPSPQIVKIEGGALPVAASPTSPVAGTPTVSSTTKAPASKSAAATEAEEVKEVKEAESPKAKTKAPIKTSSSSLEKISKSKGKKYQQAINKLIKGDQPIETGG